MTELWTKANLHNLSRQQLRDIAKALGLPRGRNKNDTVAILTTSPIFWSKVNDLLVWFVNPCLKNEAQALQQVEKPKGD